MPIILQKDKGGVFVSVATGHSIKMFLSSVCVNLFLHCANNAITRFYCCCKCIVSLTSLFGVAHVDLEVSDIFRTQAFTGITGITGNHFTVVCSVILNSSAIVLISSYNIFS